MIDRTLIALLEEALAGLPETDSPLRVRVMARLGAALQPHRDLLYPIGLAETAIAAARRIGEPETLLFALHKVGRTACAPVRPWSAPARLAMPVE